MSRRVLLRLNGVVADLPQGGDVSPSIVQELHPLGQFGKIAGNGVKRAITLPSTALNRRILGEDAVSAVITVDGIEVFTGRAVVYQRKAERGQEVSISVNLIGGNADVIGALFPVEIASLDWSDLEHNLTLAEVIGRFGSFGDYGYAVIKRGAWAVAGQVQHYECTPVIFVREMLIRAFRAVGYTLSSTFFSSSIYGLGSCIPILLPRKYGENFSQDFIGERWTSSYNLPAGTSGIVDFISGDFVPPRGSNWDGINTYTVQYDGFYLVEVRLVVRKDTPTGVNSLLALSVHLNGTPTGLMQTQYLIPDNVDFVISFNLVLQCFVGDTIDLVYFTPNFTGYDILEGSIQFSAEILIQDNSFILFQHLIGNLTVGQLMEGLTHAFNLVWSTDTFNRTILCEPSDDYFDVRSNVVRQGFYSITNLLNVTPDLSAETIITKYKAPASFVFGYSSDDATADILDKNQPLPSFAAMYDFQNGLSKSEQTLNPTFAKTLMFFDSEITVSNVPPPPQPTGLTMCIPLIYSEDVNDTVNAPNRTEAQYRLLIRAINTSGSSAAFILNGAVTNLISPYFSTNPSFGLVQNNYPSLAYGDTLINNQIVKGLMSTFYTAQLTRLKQGIVRESFYFVPLTQGQNVDFRRKIFEAGQRYIALIMDGFNPISSRSTKFKTLLDAVPDTNGQSHSAVPIAANTNPLA